MRRTQDPISTSSSTGRMARRSIHTIICAQQSRSRSRSRSRIPGRSRGQGLLAILATIDPRSPVSPADPPPGLAGLVSEDVDIQRLAAFGLSDMASELPLHEVRDGDEIVDRLHPASIDAVAIGPDGSHHLEAAIRAAHRFVYAVGPASSVERAVSSLRPGFDDHTSGPFASYRRRGSLAERDPRHQPTGLIRLSARPRIDVGTSEHGNDRRSATSCS